MEETKVLIDRILYELALCNIDDDCKSRLDADIINLKNIYLNIEDPDMRNLAVKILFAYEINEYVKFELLSLLR